MEDFLYFQSIVQYRVPVNKDGTLGNPEITKKFTSPVKGAKGYNKKKPKQKELFSDGVEEVEL